jgi:hypothetical protein
MTMGQPAIRKLGAIQAPPRERLDTGRLEVLVLARLSVVSKRRPSKRHVSQALHGMLATRLSASEWRQNFEHALDALCASGLVEQRGFELTEPGRLRLAQALTLDAVPHSSSWRDFKARYLPRLFCAQVCSPARVDVRLVLLAERLGVALEPKSTLASLLDAWLVKALDLRGPPTPARLRAALVARELGVPARATPDAVLRQGLTAIAGSPSASAVAVTDALTLRWLFGAGSASQRMNGALTNAARSDGMRVDKPSAVVLAAHARDGATLTRLVKMVEGASTGPQARTYGPNKVFIASIWEALASSSELRELGEDGFKARLVEAHRRGLLCLSRADLVAAMDPKDVAASETRHRNATYHFIVRGGTA